MATLILSAVGQAIGGPIGQAIGAIIGSQIDRAVIGGGKVRREGPRLADLAVQTASFGEPLPLVYGKSRVAGNVIWSSGLIERSSTQTTGSRKTGRISTTSYSYFASFAVALAGRPILRVERIWADGKLIRANSSGALSVGGQARIHTGDEAQPADALLEAALGMDYAPNNRGMAYAVFEELPLSEFANRVPNLTFEIVADDAQACTQGFVTADLARRAGVRDVLINSLPALCDAVIVADSAPVRGTIDVLSLLTPTRTVQTATGLTFQALDDSSPILLGAGEQGAGKANSAERQPANRHRTSASDLPGEIEVRHIDSTRDYQAGVQRARRTSLGAKQHIDMPIVMDGSRAKRIAETMLARSWRERDVLNVRVPITRLDINAGDVVVVEGIDNIWRVDVRIIEDGGITLTLLPLRLADNQSQAVADGGTPVGQVIEPQGPTTAHILDLPPVENALPATGRLIVAAAGASPAWRQASLWQSSDGGNSYSLSASIIGPTPIGTALTILGDGSANLWDLTASVDVELLSGTFELLSRSVADVLAGANLACLGQELIQFTTAEALTATRFRLSGLLRGRRGTERFTGSHALAERFVLLDPLPAARDVPQLGLLGQTLLYKALSPQQNLGDVPVQTLVFNARALRPLAPVHLTATRQATGDTMVGWIRRSRSGFDWIDGVDAPLAEDSEQYLLAILSNGSLLREVSVSTAAYSYPAAQRATDALTGPLSLRVRQMSAQVGAGEPAFLTL